MTLDEDGLLTVHTVRCYACPHAVRAVTPLDAHDRMEQHYARDHAALIRLLVRGVKP